MRLLATGQRFMLGVVDIQNKVDNSSLAGTAPTTFTRAGVRRGFIVSQPLTPGVLLYGMVFGVLASERSLLMSAFVYSGSAQLAALQGWARPAHVAPLVATILVMNARYLLYSAAMRPWLGDVRRSQAWVTLFVLGDGNWALSMKEYHAGYRDAGFVFGSGIAMFMPWLLGTLAGYLLARGVPATAMQLDPWGMRTLDSMVRAHDTFGLTRALVVSNGFHVPRAVFLGRAHGLDVTGVIAPERRTYSRETMWRNQAREVAARVWAWVDVYVLSTPAVVARD